MTDILLLGVFVFCAFIVYVFVNGVGGFIEKTAYSEENKDWNNLNSCDMLNGSKGVNDSDGKTTEEDGGLIRSVGGEDTGMPVSLAFKRKDRSDSSANGESISVCTDRPVCKDFIIRKPESGR